MVMAVPTHASRLTKKSAMLAKKLASVARYEACPDGLPLRSRGTITP